MDIKMSHFMLHAWSLKRVLLFAVPWTASPLGSSVHGIPQARILECIAISPPGDLLDTRMEFASPASPALQTDSLPLSHLGSPSCFMLLGTHYFISDSSV